MALPRKTKAAGEKLPYSFDWTKFLDGEGTIVGSSWDVPDGLTDSNPTYDDYETIVWLEGGTVGEVYKIENTITTSSGWTGVRTREIEIIPAK